MKYIIFLTVMLSVSLASHVATAQSEVTVHAGDAVIVETEANITSVAQPPSLGEVLLIPDKPKFVFDAPDELEDTTVVAFRLLLDGDTNAHSFSVRVEPSRLSSG